MRSHSELLVAALCWSSGLVSAYSGKVYTYDSQSDSPTNAQAGVLSPVAARLLLAQRAGVEDYHDADMTQQDCLDAINTYGVRSPLLGDGAGQRRRKHAFIMLEDNSASQVPLSGLEQMRTVEIDAAPSGLNLFLDLARQSSPGKTQFSQLSDADILDVLTSTVSQDSSDDVFYIASTQSRFKELLTTFASDKTRDVTGLVLSSADDQTSNKDTLSWGTWRMPEETSHFWKRQQNEAPLAGHASNKPSTHSAPVSSFASNTTTVRGILPACFSSQAACERTTHNCTGHGSCSKKYHDKDAKGGGDCYSCQCTATKSADGKVTTYWGGPACQKKDISAEFWILALFSVGLVFLVGFAIGQIWEMGEQDLPSVIGAGVSGPTAKK